MPIVKFLFKRVLILSVVLAAASFVIFRNAAIPVGIIIGSLLSVYKVRLFSITLNVLKGNSKQASIMAAFQSVFTQALTLAVLATAAIFSLPLFFSAAAGLLATAAVIIINALTELIGITHNNWNNIDTHVYIKIEDTQDDGQNDENKI